MKYEFASALVSEAVQKEFRKYAHENSLKWEQVAQNHAVRMLEAIRDVLDERISCDNKIDKIMKIILFCSVPPHIDE